MGKRSEELFTKLLQGAEVLWHHVGPDEEDASYVTVDGVRPVDPWHNVEMFDLLLRTQRDYFNITLLQSTEKEKVYEVQLSRLGLAHLVSLEIVRFDVRIVSSAVMSMLDVTMVKPPVPAHMSAAWSHWVCEGLDSRTGLYRLHSVKGEYGIRATIK